MGPFSPLEAQKNGKTKRFLASELNRNESIEHIKS